MSEVLTVGGHPITYGGFMVTYDPLNPLNLPMYTIRLLFEDGITPTFFAPGTSSTQVSVSPNVWDVTNVSWSQLLMFQTHLISVIGANGSDVRAMDNMFQGCTSLTTVPLFDTSDVVTMDSMFLNCTALKAIPLFNTANVTDMDAMCLNCTSVETGALALYQQASTQTTPPSSHASTFQDCGSNTTTGAAELLQIPNDWK